MPAPAQYQMRMVTPLSEQTPEPTLTIAAS